jgi:hypothetical protein
MLALSALPVGLLGTAVILTSGHIELRGLRGRVARADAVGELPVRLGEAPGSDGLRCLLADALGDDSLQLPTGSRTRGSAATARRSSWIAPAP